MNPLPWVAGWHRKPFPVLLPALVLLLHGVLLRWWHESHVPPRILSVPAMRWHTTRLRPALRARPVVQPAAPLAKATAPQPAPSPVAKLPVPGPATLTAPVPAAIPAAAMSAPSLAEGTLQLEYQLAEIQGVGVQLGRLQLALHSTGADYEAQADWSLGARQGSSNSRGHMDTLMQPGTYREAQDQDMVVPVSAQDPLSAIWSLRRMLATAWLAASTPAQESWRVAVQGPQAVQWVSWSFAQIDELVLPAGRYRAVQWVGQVEGSLREATRVWYAPDVAYLPVRIQKTYADGRVEDALLALTPE